MNGLKNYRLKHKQSFVQSVEFLKLLLQLVKDTLDMKHVDPEKR